MSTEKIFISGFYSSDVADTAPAWLLGKGSLHADKLAQWLTENKQLADKDGFIRYTVKKSQSTGKRYVEVDTWVKPSQSLQPDGTPYPQDSNGAVAAIQNGSHPLPTSDDIQYPDEDINPEDIPFN